MMKCALLWFVLVLSLAIPAVLSEVGENAELKQAKESEKKDVAEAAVSENDELEGVGEALAEVVETRLQSLGEGEREVVLGAMIGRLAPAQHLESRERVKQLFDTLKEGNLRGYDSSVLRWKWGFYPDFVMPVRNN